MLEIVKTLLDRLLGWPVAALVLGILFRKSIARLIDRIDKGKIAGIEVSTRSAIDQLVGASAKSAADDQLGGSIVPPSSPPTPNDPTDKRAAIENFGGNSPIVSLAMQDIVNSLAAVGFALNSADTTQLLVRHLAVTQILYGCERLYRLIFGSQITAMKVLNLSGPHDKSVLRPIYDKAVAQWPEYFSTYTFETWLSFLVQSVAVAQEGDIFAITHLGREFLGWLANNGLGEKSH